MSITIRVELPENDRFAPTALDANVGQMVQVGGEDLFITAVHVIEEGKAANVTLDYSEE